MKNKILAVILLLAAAACIALGSLGYLGSFSGGQIVLIIAMALIIFFSASDLFFAGIIFPIGILYINFGSIIGLKQIGVWPTLAICACLCLAFNIIFDSNKKGQKHGVNFDFSFGKNGKNKISDQDKQSESDGFFYEMVNFSSKTKYISNDNFVKGTILCHLGNLELYLDKVKVPSLMCSIDVECRMGNVELYIPADWNINNMVETKMGNVEEDKVKYKVVSDNAVTLYLTGIVKYGNLEIHRI